MNLKFRRRKALHPFSDPENFQPQKVIHVAISVTVVQALAASVQCKWKTKVHTYNTTACGPDGLILL